MRYIISDTHFGHGNLIDYVNRPFDTVEEMNQTMVDNWNYTVSDEDTVIHCGDIRHHPSPLMEKDWLDKLNGEILLIEGNHDAVGDNFPYNHAQSCTISHGKWKFYIEHYQIEEDIWSIGGHIHTNNMNKFPFINPENKCINVSVELINYKPLRMDELVKILNEKQRFSTLQEARDKIDYDAEIFQ